MEFVVQSVSALDTPHTLIEPTTGKIFPMVSLEMQVIQPSGAQVKLLLHFAPTHLQALLPKLEGSIRQALLLATEPGENPSH